MSKVYQFQTNINCNNCVEAVRSRLDQDDRIESWHVDIESPEKLLTVNGQLDTADPVTEMIQAAGFQAAEKNSCCEPMAADKIQNEHSFWGSPDHWKRASRNTLNCLIGCSIGDFGMIIFIQTFYPETPIMLTMALAMICGLITSIIFESVLLRIKEGFGWQLAVQTAFSMSFMSMLAMEFAENATDYLLTKGLVPPSEPFFWFALGIALIAGFLVPLPYNYYKLRKFNKACH